MTSVLQQKRGKIDDEFCQKERVVVAVKASKEVPRAALEWALTHVVQPGDRITLLLVVFPHSSGRKQWSFPRLSGDCTSGCKESKTSVTTSSFKYDLADLCSHMIFQLRSIYDPSKTKIKIKIISGSHCGAIAAESRRVQATWVVLDKQLEYEEKKCMEELQCNIVIMKQNQPEILRFDLLREAERKPHAFYPLPSVLDKPSTRMLKLTPDHKNSTEGRVMKQLTNTVGTISEASSPCLLSKVKLDDGCPTVSSSESVCKRQSPLTTLWLYALMELRHDTDKRLMKTKELSLKFNREDYYMQRALMYKFCKLDIEAGIHNVDHTADLGEDIEISRNTSLGPPPLCSICKHKATVIGKPPKSFSYAELSLATGGFSRDNFLAEGGFGFVHRGVLPDGHVVAVKQHKLASSQGDTEFWSEVEVLSCAQHRNVVKLIGFCVESDRRLLVYEYVCNGSLNFHLHGFNQRTLEWATRRKIAVGTARGLKYLHEECRVGCIIHQDMRPNNILITHDFEALVGDFGLARRKPDGGLDEETQVIGSFGYMAPEYTQNVHITEKADVYSFGVVLLELLTGRRAMDIKRPKGQHRLTEWIRPLLDKYAIKDLIDPDLRNNYSEQEALCMLHVASLCINRNPHARPRMSQVLRILEGDCFIEQRT
ncbi:inactive protein kinase SELMODRAFT_444075 [Dendrobium catenatum]|uniref:Inactive protein kinase n=1 Tax=Dendrobium catenatum TaxID=906689 RepID=A0A2I0XEQ8_9ASPA|nr:inactive protein kinase SELMODRAFT_444075 [Dendrobium catenatum]PKU86383.1 Inactive protein kinase [Dendrobium catenatum]